MQFRRQSHNANFLHKEWKKHSLIFTEFAKLPMDSLILTWTPCIILPHLTNEDPSQPSVDKHCAGMTEQ